MTTASSQYPAPRWRRVRSTPQARIALLILALTAAATALFVAVVLPMDARSSAVSIPWLGLVVAFAAADCFLVHVSFERDSHSFSLSEIVLVVGFVAVTPAHLVTAQVVGGGLAMVLYRRQWGLKLAFNVALYALVACLAVIVFAALTTGQDSVTGPVGWGASLVAVGVALAASDVLIFAVISLSEGRLDLKRLPAMLALSLPFTLGVATVGLLAVRLLDDPLALLLLALPALLIFGAYRAYTRSIRAQENLRVLHDVTGLLHQGGDADAALGDFLTAVRGAFSAEAAELFLTGSDGNEVATLSSSVEGQVEVVMGALEDQAGYERLLRQASLSGVLVTRGDGKRSGLLDAYAHARGLKDAMVAVLRTEGRVHGLLLLAGRHGGISTFSDSDVALLETFGRHVATSLERGRLEHTLHQVTKLKEQLRHQALHDALTDLPNRTLFLDRLNHAVEAASRTRAFPAVLYIDLDSFKPVNDTHGHDAGDLLLRTVATRLLGCLRPSDTAARLGGDEFAILLDGPVDARAAARVVDRIHAQLSVPVDIGTGRFVTVGASIGVSVGDAGCNEADTLVQRADAAMYKAKRAGSNGVAFFEDHPGALAQSVVRAADVAGALQRKEFFVVYQPLIDVRTGQPIGAEALVRWQHPSGRVLGPDAFIDLAEETGQIVPLGAFVLREACQQAARWVDVRPESSRVIVSVNLSAAQINHPGIVDEVADALAAAGLDPSHLVLEITETVLMLDREAAAATLWRLKALGVGIAIDDFGTGYSSLAYLRRFPIDMLKVAREFVDGLGRDAHDDMITRAIVELATTLGLATVAEGVETTQQHEHVIALKCDLAQGYLFSRPVAAEAIHAIMIGIPVPRSGALERAAR